MLCANLANIIRHKNLSFPHASSRLNHTLPEPLYNATHSSEKRLDGANLQPDIK